MKLILSLLLFVLSVSVIADNVYVSKLGNDSNSGSADEPFLTISKAASVMQPGDICIISEGFYPETVKPKNDGVTFIAEEGEKVIVSGFNKVSKWNRSHDNIYVTNLEVQLNDRNQLIYNNEMMNLARWPNKTNFNPFEIQAYKATGSNTSISYGSIPDLDWENGGVLWFLGKSRWTSWRTKITSSSAGRVGFATLSNDWQYAGSHSPEKGGEFFLQNTLKALDSNGEWYVDRIHKKLYFQAPDGEDPSEGIALVKARTTTFDLYNRSNITVEGLHIIGGSVILESAKNCVIRNCEILYGNHTIASTSAAFVSEASIKLNDNSFNNLIEGNNIQWGAANGIILKGNNNVVRNNYIGNFNYLGSYACPIELRGKNDLQNNEIFNAGRDCVRGGGDGSDCGYNNIHHSNLINDDCGAIYTCCGSFGYTRIHHNWIHDIQSRNNNYSSYKATGVYLDNSTKNVIVDHNVMWNLEWTCIQINWEGTNLLIYNNTLWSNSGSESRSMGRWVNGYSFKNVKVYNTLANNGEFHFTDQKNTCLYNLKDDPFQDFESNNFMPKENSRCIDKGINIDGYTNDFIGSAPDIGAYEYGGEAWTAGPNWQVELDNNVTSSEEIKGHVNNRFRIYPNPASNQITISSQKDGACFEIWNLSGSSLLKDRLKRGNNSVDLKTLTNGVYLLVVKNARSIMTQKLMIVD